MHQGFILGAEDTVLSKMDKMLLCLRDGILPAQSLSTKSMILGRSLGLTQPQAHHRMLGVLSEVMDGNLLAGCLA